ncbi:hypothetical protein KEH51_15780 [[Brevibacterium] frigoritolerans]|uniref:Uncharacterized protein n=1 Tax=Peribacillus frigoritolerans TaxID=450367 RepID=A0A941JAX1_9BACI|nr:hypothetical protein [Peribacillus frigoritolerans]
MISKNEEKLENFLSNIIAGIMSSSFADGFGNQLISGWLKNKKNIVQCAGVYKLVENIDLEMIKETFECKGK